MKFTHLRHLYGFSSSRISITIRRRPAPVATLPSIFSSSSSYSSSSSSQSKPPPPPPWAEQPAPPRLPKEEQEIFEKLQKASTGAFQTSSSASASSSSSSESLKVDNPKDMKEFLEHPHLQRGEKPLFEGDVNPVTGEVGGPKTDPLKYGDYAFNGRVTDF